MKAKNITEALRRARLLIHQGNLVEAITILAELHKNHPDDFDIVYMLGGTFGLSGDLDRALEALTCAVTVKPGHIDAHNLLSVVLIRKGDLRSALDHLDWVLKLDPMNWEGMRLRGTVLKDLGQTDEAIQQWSMMKERADDLPDVQCDLGLIYEERGELHKAGYHYRNVIRQPGETGFHQIACRALVRILEATRDCQGLRTIVVVYCLSALEVLSRMDHKMLHRVLLEVALAGRGGLDVNDPSKKYGVRTLVSDFNGLQLVSYLFTGFKLLGEVMDVGMDLQKEYELAYELWIEGQDDNRNHPGQG